MGPKSAATLTTCLSIPVQGAVPVSRANNHPSSSQSPGPADTSSDVSHPRRAPRKSKTEALVALQNHANANEINDDAPEVNTTDISGFYPKDALPLPADPALDMSKVKTVSPRNVPSSNRPRPFGLDDCPAFYPSAEEFKDPMGYIKSISETAKEYGICKVVPPANWKMPFVTDTEVSRPLRTFVLNMNPDVSEY